MTGGGVGVCVIYSSVYMSIFRIPPSPRFMMLMQKKKFYLTPAKLNENLSSFCSCWEKDLVDHDIHVHSTNISTFKENKTLTFFVMNIDNIPSADIYLNYYNIILHCSSGHNYMVKDLRHCRKMKISWSFALQCHYLCVRLHLLYSSKWSN